LSIKSNDCFHRQSPSAVPFRKQLSPRYYFTLYPEFNAIFSNIVDIILVLTYNIKLFSKNKDCLN